MIDLPGQLRIQVRANRLANHRLHAAVVMLPRSDFHALRAGFFASLAATLNHILAVDERSIAFCDGHDAEGCAAEVAMDRGDHVQRELAAHVLAHLFMHQTHHRGQVHAMLAGTAIAPPQLDEFLMPSEDHLRTADMAALGWTEAEVFGKR